MQLYSTNDPSHCSTWNMMRSDIAGFSFSDEETRKAMRLVDRTYCYIAQ